MNTRKAGAVAVYLDREVLYSCWTTGVGRIFFQGGMVGTFFNVKCMKRNVVNEQSS